MELPQAKGHLGEQELEAARKDPLLGALEGAWPCRHLDFRFMASRL